MAQTSAERVVSILQQNCATCHGAALKMSNLDLRTRESILSGGDHGPAIEPGNPDKSRLYRFVAGLENPTMPPGKKLSDEQVAALRAWILEGAPTASASVTPTAEEANAALAKMEERPISEEERNYWAFRAPVRAAVPENGARDPVDAFLRDALARKGLKPSPAADRRTLIRRAYLDLTGLPPSPAQVNAFVNNPAPDAFATVIEELLASPHYGERWGRHWLDMVRFADSGGFEYDRDRPNAWRYRDYVIQAFNTISRTIDSLNEQIAGDEIWPDSGEARIAVGLPAAGTRKQP